MTPVSETADPRASSAPSTDSSATVEAAIVREGVLDAVKIGAGETYLGAFGVFLGGSTLQVGALATLPPLIGAIAQSLGVFLIERIKSRRRVLSLFMGLQGVIWLPIACIPFFFESGWLAVTGLIALAIVYQVTIGVISPIWNSLVGDVVASEKRGEFFGSRNRWIAIATFLSLAVAGETIHLSKGWGATALGFSLIFLVAGCARVLSAISFGKTADPSFAVTVESKFTFWRFLRQVRRSNFVKFVFFVSGMNFAVAVSGPYFAMYMLKDLHLTYVEYTIVVATAVLAQFAVMRSWGAISDQFGNRRILSVCGWIVAFNPLMWLVSSHFAWILFVQLHSGFFWAGFNLAAANFVFDAVTPQKRARCVAYQAIINGVLVCFGSLIGGLIVTCYPQWLPTQLGGWTPASKFLLLFWVSAILRFIVVFRYLPKFKEVRQVQPIRGHEVLVRVSSLRPLSGAAFSLFTFRGRRKKEGVDDTGELS